MAARVSSWSTHLNDFRLGHHGGRHQISGDIHGSSKSPCCPCTLLLHPQTLGRNTGALPQILVMLAFDPSRKEKRIVENNKRTGYAVNTQAPWLLQNQPLSLHNPTGLHDHSQQICRKSFKRHIGIRSRTAKQLT